MRIIIFSLIFLFQPFYSYSSDDWIKYGLSTQGNTFYYKNVKKHDEYIYVERMIDYLKPTKTGMMCNWDYRQIDCRNYSWKYLNFQSYQRPLCKGKPNFDQKTIIKYMSVQQFNFNKPGQIDYNISQHLCQKY